MPESSESYTYPGAAAPPAAAESCSEGWIFGETTKTNCNHLTT